MVLNDCSLIELIPAIKDQAIRLKQIHKIKLPDAVIAATALFLGVPLLTFDSGFAKIDGLDLVLLYL